MDKIKIFKNFMPQKDYEDFIKITEKLLSDMPDKFALFPEVGRSILMFGTDSLEDDHSYKNFGIVAEYEDKIRQYIQLTINAVKNAFYDTSELYACNFWLSKQDAGGEVERHNDVNGGKYGHIKYSAVIYLNTLNSGGELEFVDLAFNIKPEAGDLVVFSTQDTGDHQVINIPEERWTIPIWITDDKSFKL